MESVGVVKIVSTFCQLYVSLISTSAVYHPGRHFTKCFSIAIQIRWKFAATLSGQVHFLWYSGQYLHYKTAKFPSNLNYEQKSLVKMAYFYDDDPENICTSDY